MLESMTEDQQLLHRYSREGSREALDKLIRRHIDLVYSAALRQVRDASLAEDVTQAVFYVLGEKAKTIRSGVAIAGWLLTVTRHASLNAIKKQSIRLRHEQAAARPETSSMETDWTDLRFVLDAAMAKLSATDRDAIVLRFFQEKSFAEVGLEASLTEEAARKRVGRALERLRGILNQSGMSLGAAAIGSAITAHAVEAAPPIVISATAGSSAAVGIAKGAISMMAWAKAKVAAMIVAGSMAIAGGSAMIVNLAMAQMQQPAPPATQNAVVDLAADKTNILGDWRLISMGQNGALRTQSTDLVINEEDIRSTNIAKPDPLQYKLEPEKRWIDLTSGNRQPMLGIYKFEGDMLHIAVSNGSPERANDFVSEAQGPNRMLMVMQRRAPSTQPVAAAPGDARALAAVKVDLTSLEIALDAFEIDTGRYPTIAQGLEALERVPAGVINWHGPYVSRLRNDPWQRPYQYIYPGMHNRAGFDIWSTGPDGVLGGGDDIGNWDQ